MDGRKRYRKTFCNRIILSDGGVCIVKDTCEGCYQNKEKCAINDILEADGTVANWQKWDVPNFRDRIPKRKHCCDCKYWNKIKDGGSDKWGECEKAKKGTFKRRDSDGSIREYHYCRSRYKSDQICKKFEERENNDL